MRVITEDSEEAKEMAKWEQHPNKYGPPGNPYVFRPYPKMLYMARKTEDGRILVLDPKNEQWSRGSYHIVNSQAEEEKAYREGWRVSQEEAMKHARGLERDISRAAAEGIYAESRMSEKARAEASAAREASAEHLAEIPAQPLPPRQKRKYVRKAKVLAN